MWGLPGGPHFNSHAETQFRWTPVACQYNIIALSKRSSRDIPAQYYPAFTAVTGLSNTAKRQNTAFNTV